MLRLPWYPPPTVRGLLALRPTLSCPSWGPLWNTLPHDRLHFSVTSWHVTQAGPALESQPGSVPAAGSAAATLSKEPAVGRSGRPACAGRGRSAALTSLLLHAHVHVRRVRGTDRRTEQEARLCCQRALPVGVIRSASVGAAGLLMHLTL